MEGVGLPPDGGRRVVARVAVHVLRRVIRRRRGVDAGRDPFGLVQDDEVSASVVECDLGAAQKAEVRCPPGACVAVRSESDGVDVGC